MKTEFRVAFLGAGRMGLTHLGNLMGIRGVKVAVVADMSLEAAQRGQAIANAERATTDIEGAIAAADVDVVMISTPTTTHAHLLETAVRAGKPVWCEKPIAQDLAGTRRVVDLITAAGVPVQIGFMRRFDPGYAAAKRSISTGKIGALERFQAMSCDTAPPPMSYIETSGGIFVDMFVHDLDLARFLMGEVNEVFAWGDVKVDPGFAKAGDVDTVVAVLRFASGALGTLQGSRRAIWGYDIRTEVAGSEGKLVVEPPQKTPLATYGRFQSTVDHFESFPDRFEAAYKLEMEAFFQALREGRPPTPSAADALETLKVALAATRSLREGRPVKVAEIV